MREVCICNFTLAEGARLPEKKHTEDAGYDVYANEDVYLRVGERAAVGTGVFFQPEPSWYIQVVPRSGLALKSGITSKQTATIKPATINFFILTLY